MKKRILQTAGLLAAAVACGSLLAGCGGSSKSSTTVGSTTVSSKAVAGPISGATVIADKLLSGQKVGNGVADAGELTTKTNPDGTFSIAIPDNYGAYVFVTLADGIDTTTGAPNPVLYAPAGSTTVTPLTSLVALAADPVAVKAQIASLGGTWDADISKPTNPDVLALSKAVETTLAVTSGAGVTPAQQLTVLTEIAKSVATATPAALTTTLSTTVQTAVNTAAASIPSVTNTTTLATAVSSAVSTVVTAVTSLPVVNGAVVETALDQTAISTAINTATTTAQSVVSAFSASIASVTLGGATIDSTTASPSVSAAAVSNLVVNLSAKDALLSAGDLTLKFTVKDTASTRSATFTYAPVAYSAASATTLTLTKPATTFALTGTTGTGAAVSAAGVTAASLTGGTNTITIDLTVAQNALVLATGGASSSLASIQKAGTYTVTVAVTSSKFSHSIIKTVVVTP